MVLLNLMLLRIKELNRERASIGDSAPALRWRKPKPTLLKNKNARAPRATHSRSHRVLTLAQAGLPVLL